MAEEFDRGTVLGKVMLVLHAFTLDDSVLGLAELARRTEIPKGTLHRVLADMAAVRLLDRLPDGYRLGGQLFELGMRASVERSLIEVAIPFMEDLNVHVQETVNLGVLDGTEVVYLSKLGGTRQIEAPSKVGGRMPLHCTAIGKMLLAMAGPDLRERVLRAPLTRYTERTIVVPGQLNAQLDRIAATGVSYEFEESAPGIVCAAPRSATPTAPSSPPSASPARRTASAPRSTKPRSAPPPRASASCWRACGTCE